MSLSLYVERVNFHDPSFSPSERPEVTIYPPSPPNDQILGSLHSSPTLHKIRTNQILIYRGSFNPPHRGHLHLLKHVFERGISITMNVIAAIILPYSDERLSGKKKAEGGNFMFGREERCLLWKQDLCFPPWAWVHNGNTIPFSTFSERLVRAVEKDGYSLEFIPLSGPGIASPSSPPDPMQGHKMIIMSDAARAANYQLSSGRLRDFDGCTKWRGRYVNEDLARSDAETRANNALLAMNTICPREAYKMLNDGPAYLEEATEAFLAKTFEDTKGVVACERRLGGQTLSIRFVKCQDMNPRRSFNDISSSMLRKVMSTEEGVKLREALDWMALSADLLWRCKASWIDKARSGTGCCIKFEESIEELQQPGSPRSYETPPHFDDPPSREELRLRELQLKELRLKELWVIESSEQSPPIGEPPSLAPPILREQVLNVEKPHSAEKAPPTNHKKRRFSATGLEEDIEILGGPADFRLAVKNAEIETWIWHVLRVT